MTNTVLDCPGHTRKVHVSQLANINPSKHTHCHLSHSIESLPLFRCILCIRCAKALWNQTFHGWLSLIALINFAIPSSLFSVEIGYPWKDEPRIAKYHNRPKHRKCGVKYKLNLPPTRSLSTCADPKWSTGPKYLNPETLVTSKISKGQIMCRCTFAQSNHTTAWAENHCGTARSTCVPLQYWRSSSSSSGKTGKAKWRGHGGSPLSWRLVPLCWKKKKKTLSNYSLTETLSQHLELQYTRSCKWEEDLI